MSTNEFSETPISVQITMTEFEFHSLVEQSTRWGPHHAAQIAEGWYEPIRLLEPGRVQLDWKMVYSVQDDMTRLLMMQAYLTAVGEPFETLWDTMAMADPDNDEDQGWPPYMLLTNYGRFEAHLCESCGLPQGNHYGDCPEYPAYVERFPNGSDPVPPNLRGVKSVPLVTFADLKRAERDDEAEGQ